MKKNDITIIIADDHPLLLSGLYKELKENDYNVIAQATDGMQALELILKLKPTVALLDIDMPLLSGFDVVRMSKGKGTHTKFIMLSLHKLDAYVMEAKSLQIDAYLLKEDPFLEIEKGIKAVIAGKTYFSNSFESPYSDIASDEIKGLNALTASEKTVLKMVAQEMPTTTIAEKLGISMRTVEKHRSNIIIKLRLKNETHSLSKWALAYRNAITEL
ncbi:response regulator [Winogradskyella sp.]|uniref:response regulator n=1 Tax=Winogradskyella sp. TaxID=1883156 RepID=UPI003BA9ADF9